MRDITYGSGASSVSLRYSLWDMQLIERRIDGVPYEPPPARAGAR